MADKDGNRLYFPKEAFHDPDTGMYRMPEPLRSDAEFDKRTLDSGVELFLPRPSHKPCRNLWFFKPASYLQVEEPLDYCLSMVDAAKNDKRLISPWFQFTDPTFGTVIAVHVTTLQETAWILEGTVDLEAVKLQIQQADHAKNMARMAAISDAKRR